LLAKVAEAIREIAKTNSFALINPPAVERE
jgi:hypothetical protein